MEHIIQYDLEFMEILNAFPILKERLKDINFRLDDLKEGETVLDYFQKKDYTYDELDLFVKKLNTDINYYLKKGEFPQVKLKDPSLFSITLEEE